jgi:hypothetical protein
VGNTNSHLTSVLSASTSAGRSVGEAIEIDEALELHILRVRGFVTADGFLEGLGTQPGSDFKHVCATWQMRGDEAAEPVVAARYRDRLRRVAEQVTSGNTKLFTGVAWNSVHDIWMELHADRIVLQRIDRAEEGSF